MGEREHQLEIVTERLTLDLNKEEAAALMSALTFRRQSLLGQWKRIPWTLAEIKENAAIGKVQRQLDNQRKWR